MCVFISNCELLRAQASTHHNAVLSERWENLVAHGNETHLTPYCDVLREWDAVGAHCIRKKGSVQEVESRGIKASIRGNKIAL